MINIIQAVLIQLAAIFGVFFILGYILSQLQSWTQENYLRSFGWRGILWTAWLGTPIHDLGHLFFAIIFRHRIDEINLFRPIQATGELGEVRHSYRQNSLYQNLGNFFIGAAPMVIGVLVLFFLLYFLAPHGNQVISTSGAEIISTLEQAIKEIFSFKSLSNWWTLNQ